jgi:hypothetical protein
LVAANHGQLLEKLKAAPQTKPLKSMMSAIEGLSSPVSILIRRFG